MPKRSAGILLYRYRSSALEVLLVHPGGPFWRRRDLGAWSIPKGEVEPGEDPWQTARRELHEETGLEVEGPAMDLGAIRQRGGKIVHAWAVIAGREVAQTGGSTFVLPWPPGSSQMRKFLEVDRAEWFGLKVARRKILASQVPLLDHLVRELEKGRNRESRLEVVRNEVDG